MHEVLVYRLGGLSLPRKSVVRLTDRPDMTLDVYRGRKTTMQQQQHRYLKYRSQSTHSGERISCRHRGYSRFWVITKYSASNVMEISVISRVLLVKLLKFSTRDEIVLVCTEKSKFSFLFFSVMENKHFSLSFFVNFAWFSAFNGYNIYNVIFMNKKKEICSLTKPLETAFGLTLREI